MKSMPIAVRRSLVAASAAMLVSTTIAGVAPAQTHRDHPAARAAAPAASTPMLKLIHAADRVTLDRYGQRVYLALGVYAAAGDLPFEIRAHRPSWAKPIQAFLETPGGEVALPAHSFSDFQRLRRFFTVSFTNPVGDVVWDRTFGFCPAGEAVRVDPEAPTPSRPYPAECPYNPFTRGAVYGISPGHALPLLGDYGPTARIPLGHYKATVTIADRYADVLGLTPAQAKQVIRVHVVKARGDCRTEEAARGCKADLRPETVGRGDGVPRTPGERPTGPALANAPAQIRPDLGSLPAYAVSLHRGYVSFAATVWNAGPSPLVVDGFRRTNEDVMDAYQYFFDADGNEIGHAPAGEMEWDARHGHQHWHFRDFARYRLLDADKQAVVRSRKEAFCLANTDAVDYTVAGADWSPYNTDLHTSCGDYTAVAVREVLDTGSGDTYFQDLPGQSFNVKNLPNGVYYISVEANPFGVLQETNTRNNNSLRKIILKGTPEHRRLIVPRKGIIDESSWYSY